MLVATNYKEFEKPKSGLYRGVLADIVDLGPQTKTYQGKTSVKPMVRLVWILNAKDSTGNYFRTMREVTASMGENATLFSIVKEVTGETPKVPFELENLLGRNNELVISLDAAKNGKQYANVKAILAPQTKELFAVPDGFVRSKDKAKQQATQQTQAPAPAPAPAAQTAPVAAQVEEESIPF